MCDSMLNTTANWFNAAKLNLSRLGMGRRVGGGDFCDPQLFFFKIFPAMEKDRVIKIRDFPKIFWVTFDMHYVVSTGRLLLW